MKLYLRFPREFLLPDELQSLTIIQMDNGILELACSSETDLLLNLNRFAAAIPKSTLARTDVLLTDSSAMLTPSLALLDTLPFNTFYARRCHPWLLNNLADLVEIHFQPIIDFSQNAKLFGYEALCRLGHEDHKVLSGDEAFTLARQVNRNRELDIICQFKALEAAAELVPPGLPVFINVQPQTIMHADWLLPVLNTLHRLNIDKRDIVIEIVESEHVDPELLAGFCDEIRTHGLRIALDDMGSGFNGLRTLAAVRADFIKIDRTIVHQAQGSRVRTVLLEAIISMAQRLGCTVVAEGLERVEDITFCRDLGLAYAQGYYFSQPAKIPPVDISPMPLRDESHRSYMSHDFSLLEFINIGLTIDLNTPVEEAKRIFFKQPDTAIAVVLDQQRPVGLLRRGKVFSTHYANLGMCCEPLPKLINHAADPGLLARSLFTERGEVDPWLLVGDEGNYLGMVQPLDVILQLIANKTSSGSLHPLSQLTTGPSLRQALDLSLRNNPTTTLVYIDLDHFKAYNDRYGFIRGDAMIRLLAEILRLLFMGQSGTLLGHIGGDDFVLILDREQAGLVPALLGVISRFHTLAAHLYDNSDFERRFFTTEDGKDHPVASISIAVVNGKQGVLANSVAAAERAALMKKIGKSNLGSIIVVEDDPPKLVMPQQDFYSNWQDKALQALAALVDARRSPDSHALDSCFAEDPFFEVVFELDAAGTQRFPNWINPSMCGKIKAGGAGIDRSQQPYYKAVADTLQPYFSSIYLSTATEDFCLTISLPMLNADNTLDGVLVADINIAAMAMLSSTPQLMAA